MVHFENRFQLYSHHLNEWKKSYSLSEISEISLREVETEKHFQSDSEGSSSDSSDSSSSDSSSRCQSSRTRRHNKDNGKYEPEKRVSTKESYDRKRKINDRSHEEKRESKCSDMCCESQQQKEQTAHKKPALEMQQTERKGDKFRYKFGRQKRAKRSSAKP